MCPSDKFVYCIECKHYKETRFEGKFTDSPVLIKQIERRCHSPTLGLHLVTKIPRHLECNFERSLSGSCGPTGKNYETIPEISK
jgi:hypothetical protein